MSHAVARRELLHTVADAYVTESLGEKKFSAIPSHDNVILRASLCLDSMDTPLHGKASMPDIWWAPLPDLIGNATALDTYIKEDLTAVTCEFTLEIAPLSIILQILDRFRVNDEGKIMEQSNYFDPCNVTNPGWQNAPSALRQRLVSGARHAARRRHHRLIRVGAGLEKCVCFAYPSFAN